MSIIQSIIIAIVEGITEFLPISSTGHMIITQNLLGITPTEFTNLFLVNIQFGAILSVIVLYWKKFIQPINSVKTDGPFLKRFAYRFDFYLKLLIAIIPAGIFGFLLSDYIDILLKDVVVVAISLIIGGVILIFIDKWLKNEISNSKISYPKAFKIGMFQVLSMIPGVSRAAATIIGGLTQKLSRKDAAEFSFLLAVPTMFGASLLETVKKADSITSHNLTVLIIGNIVAFLVAMWAIKGFISFLTKHGFKMFGYYRIFVGILILVLLYFKII